MHTRLLKACVVANAQQDPQPPWFGVAPITARHFGHAFRASKACNPVAYED